MRAEDEPRIVQRSSGGHEIVIGDRGEKSTGGAQCTDIGVNRLVEVREPGGRSAEGDRSKIARRRCSAGQSVQRDDGAGRDVACGGPAPGALARNEARAVPLVVGEVNHRAGRDRFKRYKSEIVGAVRIETDKRNGTKTE
jgi:hypothetical protein